MAKVARCVGCTIHEFGLHTQVNRLGSVDCPPLGSFLPKILATFICTRTCTHFREGRKHLEINYKFRVSKLMTINFFSNTHIVNFMYVTKNRPVSFVLAGVDCLFHIWAVNRNVQ